MVTIKPKNPNATSTLKKTVKRTVVKEEAEVKAVEAMAEEESEKVLPETVKTKKIMDYAEGNVEGDEYLVLQGEKEAKRVSVETLLNSDGDASKIVINGVEYTPDEDGMIVVPDALATEEYVVEKIAEAQLGGEEIDLSGYAKKSDLEGKVDKEEGKSLVDDAEIERLAGVHNYDDAELREMIEATKGQLGEVKDHVKFMDQVVATKDYVKEIVDMIEFPESYDDTELREMIAAIEVPSVEGLASEEFVKEQIADLVDSAPEAMDTLRELAEAINAHQDVYEGYVAQQAEALAGKVDKEEGKSLVDDAEIERLAEVHNYDDAELRQMIESIEVPSIDHLATKEEVEAVNVRIDTEVANLHGTLLSEVERINYLMDEESARAKAREDEIEAKIPVVDEFVTKDYVKEQIDAIEHPQYDDTELREMIEAIEIPEVPSIEGLATEEFVMEKIAEAQLGGEEVDLSAYATKAEVEEVKGMIPSVEGLASEEFVHEAIAGIEHPVVDLEPYAKKEDVQAVEERIDSVQSIINERIDLEVEALDERMTRVEDIVAAIEVPSVEGLATEEFVKEQVAGLIDSAPEAMDTLKELADAIGAHQDVYEGYVAQQAEALAQKADKSEIPSVEGLASEEFVREQIEAIEHPQFDDAHLATKEEVEAVKAALEEEVARAKAREDEIAAEIDDEEPYMADLAAYPTSKFLFGCGHPLYVEGQEDGSVVVSYKWAGEMVGITLSAEDAAKTYIVGGYGHDNHNSKRSLPMTKVVAKDAKIKGIVGGHYFEGIVGHAHIEAENCQMVAVMAGGWCGANVDGRTTRLNIVHEAECKLTNCTVSSTFFGGSQGNGTVDKSHVVLDGVKAKWVTVGGSNGLTNEGHLEVMGESEITVLQTVNRGLVRKARVDIHEGQVKQLFVGGETEDSTVNGIVNEVEMNLMSGVIDKLRLGTSEGQPFAGQLEGSMRQPEVKESEVDLGLFKVIEDEVLPEYALKDHTHEGMATEDFVREEIAKAQLSGGEGEVDLSAYATKAEVEEAIAGIEHPVYDDTELRQMIEAIEIPEIPEVPSIDHLATKEELEAAIAGIEHPEYDDSELRGMIEAIEVPSVEGLASEEFVRDEIAKAQLADGEVDLSAYATKAEVEAAIAGIEHPVYDDSELRDMIEAIEIPEVPSLEGYATEAFVEEQIAGIEHPVYDDSELRGMIEAIEVPSVEGLASEEFVEQKIAEIEHPTFDDSHLATKEELEGKVDAVEGKSLVANDEIARLAEVFNANYQFRINMLPAGQEAYVNMTGQYPNIVVTFNIPMGSAVTPEEPEEPAGTPKVFYGWIPYDETGAAGFCTPEEIHEGMDAKVLQFGFDNGTLFEAEPGEITHEVKAPDNAWICTVIPVDSELKGYIDDGIGGLIGFAEMDTASGFACDDLIITEPIDGVKYKVSGLYVVTAGAETTIYIK